MVFWGVGFTSICLSYVSDGEKCLSSFYESDRWGRFDSTDVKFWFGLAFPFIFLLMLIVLYEADTTHELYVGVSLTLLLSALYILLRISRKALRFSKLLAKHVEDKGVHSK